MEGISERLKEFVNSTGLNLKTFALTHDINVNTLSKNINEGNIPGGEVLKKLGIAGLNINWLLTGIGEMTIASPGKSKLAYLEELKDKILSGVNLSIPFASDSIWFIDGSHGLSDLRTTFEKKATKLLIELVEQELQKEIQKQKDLESKKNETKNKRNYSPNLAYYLPIDIRDMLLKYSESYVISLIIELLNTPDLKQIMNELNNPRKTKLLITNKKNNNK